MGREVEVAEILEDNLTERVGLEEEEEAVEEMVVEMIRRGDNEGLKTNSGEWVYIRDHYICVYCNPPLWAWNGFLTLYHQQEGVSRHYIYGHYFEDLEDDDIPVN
ncbi:hypothetical protein SUGI_0920050 [Cryptomeria japonica]|nr:hypothetical protein SUGI_0920050 [Cryptomeria japonica]